MQETQFVLMLWFIGIVAEAMTGALAAGKQRMDLFGVVIVGSATAVGGGTLRDMMLGNYPLIWIENWHYLLAIVLASLLTVVIAPVMQYLTKLFLTIDALGLAVFSVIGAQKTLMLGLSPAVAIVMGVITGVFGGVIRDILCNQVPLIFRKELYGIVAIVTASCYVTLQLAGTEPWLNLSVSLWLGFSLRMLAIRFSWSVPTFHYSIGERR
ncbi:trimeric intracellular cation channel family protein [Shewanella yunxiaonensis]|uniref:Trimeric intracellular cation channel family protein n=1 Tax=Shewanella yunxiaonensis TaxID=2829809 RepID=A0ABX7YWH5_9GAMM|nr:MULTISPECIES: trimeric intracellular cation channel family protein [Shewanella]MDF0532808.1 trimeric intracellular cation channel family protein [Shewanella sp. A32]QUN06691.1 trimeric intracellular cation channel family protein [Shewanella yunxiaonensis]